MDSQIFHEISPESYIYRTYENESQLDDIYMNSTRFVFGIIFHDSFFNYTIKIDNAFVPLNKEDPIPYYKQLESPNDSGRSTYEVFFSPIQKAVDEAILRLVLNNRYLEYEVNLAQFAEPEHHCAAEKAWEYNYSMGLLIGVFLLLTKDIVRYIVDEKQNNIKISFTLMGIKSSYIELSWIVLYCIKYLISIILISFIITLIPVKVSTYDPVMFFFIFSIYGLSVIDKGIRIILSPILTPVSVISILGEINKIIGIYNHINYMELFHGDMLLFYCMLIVATIFYFIIPYILDKSLIKRKLHKEYTSEYGPIRVLDTEKQLKLQHNVEDFRSYNNLSVAIELNNVTKKIDYKANKKVMAVDTLNVKIFEGEIFGVLGDEGSGKKTLMHMMLGNIKPTTGEILFHDQNICNNSKIKKDI
eukprot:jgi/Orpsp1_1/1174230/evm.model.c7180000049349.1